MIHIKVINKVDHDVFMIILQNTWFTSIEVDFSVYRFNFHNCQFLESESEAHLEKMSFNFKIRGTITFIMNLPNTLYIHTNCNKFWKEVGFS